MAQQAVGQNNTCSGSTCSNTATQNTGGTGGTGVGAGVGVGVGKGIGVGTASSSSTSGSISASESNALAASGTANSGNSAQGQSISIKSTVPSNTSATIKNVPSVYAPGLAAAGSEVCLGSLSVGGAGAGFGFTIGGTMSDRECTLRLNAKTLAILGYTEAARETMCLDDNVRRAMLAAGTPCSGDRGGRGVDAMASARTGGGGGFAMPGGSQAGNAYAMAGRNCRKEFNLTKGWYDICE
jgi:hypothetical protein